MGCTVDKNQTNEVYPSCVIDYGKPEDCLKAKGFIAKEECAFWIPDKKSVRPCCNREIPVIRLQHKINLTR